MKSLRGHISVAQRYKRALDRSTNSQRSTVIVSRSSLDNMPHLETFVKRYGTITRLSHRRPIKEHSMIAFFLWLRHSPT
jgi:hypothetical protein